MLWNWLESPTSLWPLGTPPGDPGCPSSKPQAPPPVLRRAGHLPSQPRLQIHSSPAHLLQLWPSSAVGMRTSILDHCPLQGRGGLHLAPRACPRQWFLWNWCVWWDGGIGGGGPQPAFLAHELQRGAGCITQGAWNTRLCSTSAWRGLQGWRLSPSGLLQQRPTDGAAQPTGI